MRPDLTTDRLWKLMLELRLRSLDGDAFQDFFASVMEAAYGDDFVRVKAHGRIGDKGCDGYLKSTGEVFACHGTQNGHSPKVSAVLSKLKSDFDKAKAGLKIMKKWTFVNNMIKGLPIDAVTLLEDISNTHALPTSHFGRERFEVVILGLPPNVIVELLGDIITEGSALTVDLAELREIVKRLAADGSLTITGIEPISPVSEKKLDCNLLTANERELLLLGIRNSKRAKAYFDGHPDPLLGQRTAEVLRTKFLQLESQKFSPGDILVHLVDYVRGDAESAFRNLIPTMAVVGYFFETCTILRDAPAP